MIKRVFKNMDYSLIVIVLILFIIGIIALNSANGGVNGNMEEVSKQLIWFSVGIVCMILVLLVDYEIFREAMDFCVCGHYFKPDCGFVHQTYLWGTKLVYT